MDVCKDESSGKKILSTRVRFSPGQNTGNLTVTGNCHERKSSAMTNGMNCLMAFEMVKSLDSLSWNDADVDLIMDFGES